jgi:long-chain acyl-CoA synthetase
MNHSEILAEIRRPGGIVGRLRRRSEGRGHMTALVGNRSCLFPRLTYEELFQAVDEVAAGFLELGIGPGDHVGLIAENSDAWLLSDLALQSLGAVDVPRGADASGEEIAFCLTHGSCRAAVLDSAELLSRIGEARAGLDPIVILRGEAPPGTVAFAEMRARGRARLQRRPGEVRALQDQVGPNDLATVIYTSGTTGNPKGVMLTHQNLLHNVAIVPGVLHLAAGGRFLSFLPSWHSFERVLDYVVLDSGMELHYSTKWTLREDFRRVRPQFVAGVPRLWETFYAGVLASLESMSPARRRIARALLSASQAHARWDRRSRGREMREDGSLVRPGPLARLALSLLASLTWPVHRTAERLVYRRLREALGGELLAMVSGGGPLPLHVDEFYVRAGLPFLNGYGLTESSPVISVRILEHNLVGTIGPPIPLTEVRIVGEDGRVLPPGQRGTIQARGPQIMAGYWRNPEATSRALLGEGWLDTGDLGYLTAAGDIVITGRAKDTIVLRSGENVEPEPLESVLASSPLVADALVVGHARKSLGALIVPDPDGLRARCPDLAGLGDEAVVQSPLALAAIRADVAALISRRRGYRNFELIGPVAVLPRPFSVEEGTLTATLKKRRGVIEERFAPLIEQLFGEDLR